MRAAAVSLFILGATALSGASDGLTQRVRQALGPAGTAEEAAGRLTNKDYVALDALLAAASAPDAKTRADLMALRGAVAFLRGDMAAAIADFENAQRLVPLADEDAFTESMALVSLGERAQARPILERLERSHADQAIYIYWLGKLDFDEHRYGEAEAQLRAALKRDPGSARVWDSLGLTLDMQGQLDAARSALEKSAALNRQQAHPSPWPAHDLGYLLFRMNHLAEAEAELRESLSYNESFATAHYHLGRTLEKEGSVSDALAEYEIAVNEDEASSDACYSLALLYRKLHRDADAAAMFSEYKRRRQVLP